VFTFPDTLHILAITGESTQTVIKTSLVAHLHNDYQLTQADVTETYDESLAGTYDLIIVDSTVIQTWDTCNLPTLLVLDSDQKPDTHQLPQDYSDYVFAEELSTRLLAKTIVHLIHRRHYDATIQDLHESRHLIDRIFLTMPDAVNIFDRVKDKQLFGNKRIFHDLGYTDEEVQAYGSQIVDTLIHPDDVEIYKQHKEDMRALDDDNVLHLEIRLKHKHGGWAWMYSHYTIFQRDRDGKPIEILGIAQDISELKRAEMALIESLQASKTFNRLKSNFITQMSHEFRTPLSIIQLVINNIDRNIDNYTAEKRQEKIKTIYLQIKKLIDMLNKLFVVSEVDTGKLILAEKQTDVVQWYTRTIDRFEHNLETSHQIISAVQTHTTHHKRMVDPTLLQYILENILDNCVKFSDPETPIHVSLMLENDHFTLTVQDAGIGIPEDEQDKVLTPFYRASNIGQIAGIGLGLYIANYVSRLCGGALILKSEVSAGTEVVVNIPAQVK